MATKDSIEGGEEMSIERKSRTDKKYVEYVKCQSCAFCGADGQTEAHHEPLKSQGGCDYNCIPLCIRCHHDRHTASGNYRKIVMQKIQAYIKSGDRERMLVDYLVQENKNQLYEKELKKRKG